MERLLKTIIVILLVTPVLAHSEITVRVTKALGDAQPIAIVPFAFEGEGKPPLNVSDVVANDLARSGRFKPFPVADMLETPSEAKNVNLQNWRMLNVDYVVVGKVKAEGKRYVILFQLLDVYGGKQLLGYSIPVSANYLRRGAHQVSDLIYKELTGVPGAFSTRIAFVMAVKDGDVTRYQLVVADADGENQRTILRSNKPIMSPAWSPDSTHVAYVSFENDTAEIYEQELSSGKREVVSSRPGINGAPSYSPDGRWLAMTLSSEAGNPDIWVKNRASGEMQRVTTNPAIETEPVWTPDSQSLYFTSDRGGGPQIYRAKVGERGNKPERVTFEGNYNARATLSPDGKLLGMVHQDAEGFHIAVLDLANRSLQILTDGRLDESPSFAPNGAMIIYATNLGNQGVLAATSVDGRVQQRLAVQEGDVREPAWSPNPPTDR